MTAERLVAGTRERKTGVRLSNEMDRGFNMGWGVTFRYQARTHPPLSEVVRRKTGANRRPRGLDTSIFLCTHYKHFPTDRVISAQSWGVSVGSRAVSMSCAQ